jgi:hypothetical protein
MPRLDAETEGKIADYLAGLIEDRMGHDAAAEACERHGDELAGAARDALYDMAAELAEEWQAEGVPA